VKASGQNATAMVRRSLKSKTALSVYCAVSGLSVIGSLGGHIRLATMRRDLRAGWKGLNESMRGWQLWIEHEIDNMTWMRKVGRID
jgi:hypothetical protein